MDFTEIMGMAIGARKNLRANGRFKVGQVLYDNSPFINEVLRVVEVSHPIFWDRDRIDDEDEFHRYPGEVTTDIVVERIERSPQGHAVVEAFQGRFREPVKVVGGELLVNACEELENGFFRQSGEVRPLAKNHFQQHPALAPSRSEPVSGFGHGQLNRVYVLPADGWYEASAMRSPSSSEQYFFRLNGGKITELISSDSLNSRYGMNWMQLYEANCLFRQENGV